MKIKIVNKGAEVFADKNYVYIGRPSVLKNPFPTKPSKFSTLIYSHEKSMRMYLKFLEKQILDKNPLIINELNIILKQELTLSCFCIVSTITESINTAQFNPINVRCHGEIIAYVLFKYKEIIKKI